MLESRRGRSVGVASLVCALAGLCVWYGALAPDPAAGAFPENEAVLSDTAAYVGDRVVLSGQVVGVDPVVISVRAGGVDQRLPVRIEGIDRPVARGVALQVYGVLQSERTLRTLGVVVTPPGGLAYAVITSLVGGVWVCLRLVREWRIDRERWELEPRESPRSLPTSLGGREGPGNGGEPGAASGPGVDRRSDPPEGEGGERDA